jgi:catechol 2,3-dioxygenase-like lactoylglutathione lyase family enzyme
MPKDSASPERLAAEPMVFQGANHVALVCRDMAETVDFYENILGMPLVKTVELPGHGQHFFFDCGGGGTLAFMWFKHAPPAAPGIASQHRDVRKDGAETAIASMNHLAISIPLERFDDYVQRLKDRGLKVAVINHNDGKDAARADLTANTWIRSVYFRDPNGIALELAALARAWRPDDVNLPPVNAEGQPVAMAEAPA